MKLLDVAKTKYHGKNITDVSVPPELRVKMKTGIPFIDFALGGGLTPSTAWMVTGDPGCGKCLKPGTPVLMFDGRTVNVEDVKVGDQLMGPDSLPRRVLSTTRGHGPMFKIVPIKGDPWVCNDVHVLTLVNTGHKDAHKRRWKKNEVIDIPLDEYLKLGTTWKSKLKQFFVGVDFPSQTEPLPIDPYFLGVWYGDGAKTLDNVSVSKPDPEIEALMNEMASKWSLSVRKHVDERTGCPTFFLTTGTGPGLLRNRNDLLQTMRAAVGDGNKFPQRYLTASRGERAAFLAGLLDTDGSLRDKCFDIVQKRKEYAEGICFLARSLGIRAIMVACEKTCQTGGGGTYWRVSLSGDMSFLPLRIARKKCGVRLQSKDVRRTGFDVEPLGEGDYAGFTLDGDGRFLLGDFTVTHNTTLMLTIANALTKAGHVVLYNGREESVYQVKIATERLGLSDGFIFGEDLFVQDVVSHAKELQAGLAKENKSLPIERQRRVVVIPDSLQCLDSGKYDTGRKTKNTPIQCATELIKWAKCEGVSEKDRVFGVLAFINHVTKSGNFAGDNTLLHAVDARIHFGFDRNKKSETFGERILTKTKDRFGPAAPPMVIEMGEGGVLAQKEVEVEEQDIDDLAAE